LRSTCESIESVHRTGGLYHAVVAESLLNQQRFFGIRVLVARWEDGQLRYECGMILAGALFAIGDRGGRLIMKSSLSDSNRRPPLYKSDRVPFSPVVDPQDRDDSGVLGSFRAVMIWPDLRRMWSKCGQRNKPPAPTIKGWGEGGHARLSWLVRQKPAPPTVGCLSAHQGRTPKCLYGFSHKGHVPVQFFHLSCKDTGVIREAVIRLIEPAPLDPFHFGLHRGEHTRHPIYGGGRMLLVLVLVPAT